MKFNLQNSIGGRLLILIVSGALIVGIPLLIAKIPLVNKIASNEWPYIMKNPEFAVSYGVGVLAIMVPFMALMIAAAIIMWVLTGYK